MFVRELITHVPPLRQGRVKHVVSCCSQRLPVKPAGHKQVGVQIVELQFKVDGIHCPPLRHGDGLQPLTK